ncbi:alpha/beta hydrolase family protein [Tenggerimyces flavus]|uniref:S9 family peptidase n=1 Tax=Tenggerimyces flavus TaxID=1708749 RepID=A0ABV7YL62_9ACTN|nr:S9 family peptidase [Tenggerimyces flavus]MBM7785875.1 dipeptidyl aminopeptidase/acylaminoacyl peptidase [Tenggerimyces flavus]
MRVEEWFAAYLEPSLHQVSGAAEVVPSPDGEVVAFVGSILTDLNGTPIHRLHLLDVARNVVTPVGGGEDDKSPEWSPDGRLLAYVTTDGAAVVTRDGTPADVAVPTLPGVAEYVRWSPSGTRLLVGVADPGSDVAGAAGSGTLPDATTPSADWAPAVVSCDAEHGRRWCAIVDLRSGQWERATSAATNVWEAAWCGEDELLAVVSTRADEGAWYAATAAIIELRRGEVRTVHRSDDQLGSPTCSPSGWHRSLVQAVASDRGFVQGELLMLDRDGFARPIDTRGVDVTDTCWRTEDRLTFAGLRGLESVAGEVDVVTGEVTELWATTESFGGKLPRVRPSRDGTVFTASESHRRFVELVAVTNGKPTTLLSFAHDGVDAVGLPTWRVEPTAWTAPDGLEIQGLLSLPPGSGPFPLVLSIHGGPVGAFRDRWLMSYSYLAVLLSRGYAVLQANPRGSTGRGQDFARLVKGDLNGADTLDLLSGVDAVVADGLADPSRLAVTGGSYGGNMTAWLITQDQRFAAAAPQHPHTDYVSFHFSSNIPEFDALFLDSDPLDPAGRHVTRSPFRYAANVRTPMLQLAGGLDRCCPPEQAVLFHNAVAAHGVPCELAVYPQEGHGVRAIPAVVDSTARLVSWFDRFLRP